MDAAAINKIVEIYRPFYENVEYGACEGPAGRAQMPLLNGIVRSPGTLAQMLLIRVEKTTRSNLLTD